MPPRAQRRIFISYRRSDTQGYAGWLHQLLEEHYGRSNVFRDVDSIQPGQHYPTEIARTIATCTDAVALIGPAWLEPGPRGTPRLFEPDDWVRLELETAIQRGLRILPLLMGATPMPNRGVLPASLYALAERQSFVLRDAHFAEDVRSALSRTDQAADTDREYLGNALRSREARFAALLELFTERLERDAVTVRSVPWRRAENLRPQLNALMDVLEPDEDVADMALAAWSEDLKRDAAWTDVVREMRDSTLLGVLAVTPRRIIYAPRLKPSSTSVIWFRDIIDVKMGVTGSITGDLKLVLGTRNVALSVRPVKRAGDIAGYVRDRLERR